MLQVVSFWMGLLFTLSTITCRSVMCLLSVLLCDIGTAPGISASPSEENLRYFHVMILGPTSSPYEGRGASRSNVSAPPLHTHSHTTPICSPSNQMLRLLLCYAHAHTQPHTHTHTHTHTHNVCVTLATCAPPALKYPEECFLPASSLTGGVFKLELFLPDDYPMAPPKVPGARRGTPLLLF